MTLQAAASGQGMVPGRPTLALHRLATDTLAPLFDSTAVPACRATFAVQYV